MEEFVMSFEDACARLGIGTELPEVSAWPVVLQKHLIALYKLSKILEVNNGDWVPDLADTDQWKYYPWFRIVKKGPSGFGLSFNAYAYDCSISALGARLACKNRELAEFMGRNCTELYEDLHS